MKKKWHILGKRPHKECYILCLNFYKNNWYKQAGQETLDPIYTYTDIILNIYFPLCMQKKSVHIFSI